MNLLIEPFIMNIVDSEFSAFDSDATEHEIEPRYGPNKSGQSSKDPQYRAKSFSVYFYQNGHKLINRDVTYGFILYLATEWLETRKGLFISGDKGIGKTFTMSIVAKFFNMKFIDCENISIEYMNSNTSRRKEIIRDIGNKKRHVVFDGLDQERTINIKNEKFELISTLISYRARLFEKSKGEYRTLFTCRRGLADIGQSKNRVRYNDRTIRLISKLCVFKHCTGKDLNRIDDVSKKIKTS